MALYLGLISGTSMDAIDAVLLEIASGKCSVRHALAVPYAPALRDRLFAVISGRGGSLDELGHLDTAVGAAFAEAALELLAAARVAATEVDAIGSHGQTIWHRPAGEEGFSMQIGNPHLIAERTGITTVADFRRRDIAAGGEGAPLMPAFHQAVFASKTEPRAVVNIGGIANVTSLPVSGAVIGFDTGPGNCLMDGWIARHQGTTLDRDGSWAASGRVDQPLLSTLLFEPYFELPAPKSTGRELFNMAWLDARLAAHSGIAPADVQATLCELTTRTICAGLRAAGDASLALLCGGGVHNRTLVQRLAELLPAVKFQSTASLGISPDYIEGAGFAWLAQRALAGLPGNLPAVTGARKAVILGAIHPGAGRVTRQ